MCRDAVTTYAECFEAAKLIKDPEGTFVNSTVSYVEYGEPSKTLPPGCFYYTLTNKIFFNPENEGRADGDARQICKFPGRYAFVKYVIWLCGAMGWILHINILMQH